MSDKDLIELDDVEIYHNVHIISHNQNYMAKFNLEIAKFLVEFAIRAYNDETELALEELNFELVQFVDNKVSDTQAFIAKDDTRLVVAFRGTSSVKDAWTDIKIKKQTFPRFGFFRRLFSFRSLMKSKAHEGFFKSYESVSDEIKSVISKILSEKNYMIFTTGHSLGGSLATLCALDLTRSFKQEITNYTFGAPKVGNKQFVKVYNKTVNNTFRVVNDDDPVPSIPGLTFKHVKHTALIDEKITIKIDPGFLERLEKGMESVWSTVTIQIVKQHSSHNYKALLQGIQKIEE